MKAITKEYLNDIIYRCINVTINNRREAKKDYDLQQFPMATDAEILEFIHTIPFFDLRLKDFLAGNLEEDTIILSQAWEIEFLKKVQQWAASFEWLDADHSMLTDLHLSKIKQQVNSFLKLPY